MQLPFKKKDLHAVFPSRFFFHGFFDQNALNQASFSVLLGPELFA